MLSADLAGALLDRLPGAGSAEFRAILRQTVEEATGEADRSFSGFYARLAFLFDRDATPEPLRHALRRVMTRRAGMTEAASALGAWIAALSGLPVPGFVAPLSDLPDDTGEELPALLEFDVRQTREIVPGREWEIDGLTPDGDPVTLRCRDQNHSGDERHAGRMFQLLGPMSEPFSRLHAFRLRRDDDGVPATTPHSLLVLEPDLLLNITDLAECFLYDSQRRAMVANPRLYLLRLFLPFESSPAILRGTLVNEAFDFVFREGRGPEPDELRGFLSGHMLTVARMTPGEVDALLREVADRYVPGILAFHHANRNRPVTLEPSFIAPEYGLQGRLDALFEDPDDPLRKSIVELKSGKPPQGGRVWDSHALQVTGYNLLLRSAYTENRRGDSAIFHPAAAENPVRNVYASEGLEQRLLMVRNEIVRTLRDWAAGDFSTLDRFEPGRFGPCPTYAEPRLGEFAAHMQAADSFSRAWFRMFTAATLTGMIRAKTGSPDHNADGFNSLWRETAADRKLSFSILDGLEPVSTEGLRTTFRRSADRVSNFREGDIVVLTPDNDDPLRDHPLLRGAVERLGSGEVVIRFWGDPGRTLSRWPVWNAGHDLFDRNHVSQLQSLYRVLAADERRRELVLGLRPPEPPDPVTAEFPGLSDTQAGIVRRCLGSRDLHLVLGPPGTGKTSLVMSRIVAFLRREHPNRTVVVLAFTNRAVEEISIRLHGMDLLRLGREGEHSLRARAHVETHEQLRRRVLDTRIVVGTVFSFLERFSDLQALMEFDTVIIDEASQLLEPQVAGILAAFRRAILIGDHLQLPPVTTLNRNEVVPPELAGIGYTSAGESLFERLFRRYREQGWDWAVDTLDEHYRMHADIAEAVNPYYDGRLRTVLDRQVTPLTDSLAGLPDGARRVFIPSTPELSAQPCHRGEAETVAALLREVRSRYPDQPYRVGVITPFRAQISLIRSLLDDDPWFAAVTVDTVERFQGSERDLILFSSAVGHASHLGRMASERNGVDRKLNVAVSRARERFVLLGDPGILMQSPHYRRLMEMSARP